MAYVEESKLIEQWIEGSEIVLDNIPMVIEGGVGYTLQNVYGRNQRFGEPGPDDHPYNTTYTQRSWVGGLLIHDSIITRDFTKGWDGDAWTQTRGALGAGLAVDQIPLPDDSPGGVVTPLTTMGRKMYLAVGNSNGRIYEFVEETHTTRNPGGGGAKSFAGSVANKAVRFRVSHNDLTVETQMYIPTSTGYTRMAEDFTTHDEEGLPTIAFVIHEDKIYRLCANGQVYWALDHDDAWTYVAVLPDDTEPRNAYRAADDEGNRTVAVTSSGGQYLLDHDNGLLYATDLTFPEHAFQGYGATVWRVDDYVSVGVGIHRKAGGLIVAAGLDDNDGLPAGLAGGFITDLEPSYNMLFAAIAGPVEGDDDQPTIYESAFGLTQGLPYPLVGSGENAHYLGTNRVGAIYAWNGLGWSRFHLWNRPPTRVVVAMIRNASDVETHQHVFFGDVDGGFYTIHIPSGYYNPVQAPNLPLRRSSYYEASRIDWGAPDIPKIAKQINIKPDLLTHKVNDLLTYQNEIQIVLKWRDLDGVEHSSEDADVLNGPGPYPFCSFNVETGRGVAPIPYLSLTGDNSRRSASVGWERYKNTGVLLPTGLPHDAIWPLFRWNNTLDSETSGAVIEWYTLLCRKWMRPNRVWSFRINMATAIKGVSEHGVAEILDSICLKKSGVPMVTGDHFYIVDVTQLGGSDEAGLNPRGYRTITCLEMTDVTYEDSINALTDL